MWICLSTSCVFFLLIDFNYCFNCHFNQCTYCSLTIQDPNENKMAHWVNLNSPSGLYRSVLGFIVFHICWQNPHYDFRIPMVITCNCRFNLLVLLMTHVNLLLGVVKREFLLSTQPVEGDWKISVTAAEVRKSAHLHAILAKNHCSKIKIPINSFRMPKLFSV